MKSEERHRALTCALGVPLVFAAAACTSGASQPAAAGSKTRLQMHANYTQQQRAELVACYDAAVPKHPGLAVNTSVAIIGRRDRLLLADIDIPEAPELAKCITDKITSWTAPFSPPPSAGAANDAAWVGGMAIELGPPTPIAHKTPPEVRERLRQLVLDGLRRGLLHRSDALVEQTVNPPAPWPNAEQRAQLDACYTRALPNHPGLVVHTNAAFLVKDGKVALADVSVPEAPELGECLEGRIAQWESPFPHRPDAPSTTVSGFFVDLGGPSEFPKMEGNGPFTQQDRLIRRAVERGLVAENDPLAARAKKNPRP